MPTAKARWAVMLDLDAVLLEGAAGTTSRALLTDVIPLLSRLHRVLDGALALISDRELCAVDKLFGPSPWAVAALCGLELRHADGSFRRRNIDWESQTRMHDIVAELASRLPGVELEQTLRTATLHCAHEAECLMALRAASKILVTQLPGYELQADRYAVAVRPRGMNNGMAVREFLRHPVFSGRMPVYLGRDLNDENAFKRVNRVHGSSVRVGSHEPTQARFSLPDSAASRVWLGDVAQAFSLANPQPERPVPGTSGLTH